MSDPSNEPDDERQHHREPGPWDDETAEWYVENWGEHATNRMTVERAELAPDDVVVDIGCGSGSAVREAARRLVTGRAHGVDPTPAMRRLAAEHTASHAARERITYHHGDASHLPFEDASVTVALAVNSVHHWNDVPAGLREVLRVLAPNGRLVIGDETEDGVHTGGEGEWTDPERVVRAAEDTGFTDVTLTKLLEGDVAMFLIRARKSRA